MTRVFSFGCSMLLPVLLVTRIWLSVKSCLVSLLHLLKSFHQKQKENQNGRYFPKLFFIFWLF